MEKHLLEKEREPKKKARIELTEDKIRSLNIYQTFCIYLKGVRKWTGV